jgi:hypothetical protein
LIWRKSADPDFGDLVTYIAEISPDTLFNNQLHITGLQDTTLVPSEYAQFYNFQNGAFYYWRVKALDNHNNDSGFCRPGYFQYQSSPTGVEDPTTPTMPTEFTLAQNYPNPFNPTTQIRYDLPAASVVTLAIFDITGKEIRKLADHEDKSVGSYTLIWDGRDNLGNAVASGVYFYSITAQPGAAGEKVFYQVKKMTFIK